MYQIRNATLSVLVCMYQPRYNLLKLYTLYQELLTLKRSLKLVWTLFPYDRFEMLPLTSLSVYRSVEHYMVRLDQCISNIKHHYASWITWDWIICLTCTLPLTSSSLPFVTHWITSFQTSSWTCSLLWSCVLFLDSCCVSKADIRQTSASPWLFLLNLLLAL